MLKSLVRTILNLLKGRSARHTVRSELDNFLHEFEQKRADQPLSRKMEIKKARDVAYKRDNFSSSEKTSFLDS